MLSLAGRFCGFLDPTPQVLVAIVVIPQVELVARRYFAAAQSRISRKVLDFADVDAEEPIASCLALRDLIFDPLAAAGVETNEYSGDGGPLKLLISPRL